MNVQNLNTIANKKKIKKKLIYARSFGQKSSRFVTENALCGTEVHNASALVVFFFLFPTAQRYHESPRQRTAVEYYSVVFIFEGDAFQTRLSGSRFQRSLFTLVGFSRR